MSEITVSEKEMKRIWGQKQIPVVLRRGKKGQHLRIRIPYSRDNRNWLRNERRASPTWVGERKYWEIPKAWFNDFVERALQKYGRLYVVQPYREQEKCAPACMSAVGHECQCSCMGANHGAGNDGMPDHSAMLLARSVAAVEFRSAIVLDTRSGDFGSIPDFFKVASMIPLTALKLSSLSTPRSTPKAADPATGPSLAAMSAAILAKG
jgi:hypothetical protein